MEQVSLDEIRGILDKALTGKVLANVFDGEGEMLYVGFGQQVLRREVREHRKKPGEFFFVAPDSADYEITTFFSHWQIEDRRGILLKSEDDWEVEMVAAVFLGRRVTNWLLHDDGGLDIEFDGVVTFAICPGREETKEGATEEAWALDAYENNEEVGSWGITTFGEAYIYGPNESLRFFSE